MPYVYSIHGVIIIGIFIAVFAHVFSVGLNMYFERKKENDASRKQTTEKW